MHRSSILIFFPAAVLSLSAQADTIVQTGTISDLNAPPFRYVDITLFDTMGGTNQLNFVQIDFLTSIIGGYTTDGSGVPVHIFAQLDAEWVRNGVSLAITQALIDTIVPNTNEGSATVFNTDTAQVIFDQPADLATWIGTGTTFMGASTQFQVFEDPPDIIFFGAGGTVRWTVTYDYTVVPAPGALALLIVAGLHCRRRR